MSELDRLHDSMQDGFTTIYKKLDILQEKQISNQKDIEYIKKEINGKLDERMETKIDLKLLKTGKRNFKENKKMWVAIITSITALAGVLLNIILG